jgi:hypothetical protein
MSFDQQFEHKNRKNNFCTIFPKNKFNDLTRLNQKISLSLKESKFFKTFPKVFLMTQKHSKVKIFNQVMWS